MPPLERVFNALNINKTDLVSDGRQLGLFEAMKNCGVSKKTFVDILSEIDGFICNNCNTTYKRIPLSGKCNSCDGELVFYKGEKRSREYKPCKSQSSTK